MYHEYTGHTKPSRKKGGFCIKKFSTVYTPRLYTSLYVFGIIYVLEITNAKMKKIKNIKNEDVEKIVARFSINRLQMDAALTWLLDIEVGKILPETFLRYNLELVFNETPYLNAIKNIEEDIAEVEKQNSLFKTERQAQIKALNRDIKNTREDMEELKKDCPTITIAVKVKELKYKEAIKTTFVRMVVPDEAINTLNDNKHKFKHYQAELTPSPEPEQVPDEL